MVSSHLLYYSYSEMRVLQTVEDGQAVPVTFSGNFLCEIYVLQVFDLLLIHIADPKQVSFAGNCYVSLSPSRPSLPSARRSSSTMQVIKTYIQILKVGCLSSSTPLTWLPSESTSLLALPGLLPARALRQPVSRPLSPSPACLAVSPSTPRLLLPRPRHPHLPLTDRPEGCLQPFLQ